MDTNSLLSYFRTLASTYGLPDCQDDIRRLARRNRDPQLRLCVVGEFSSGKSTFINALLGRRVLKEAVRPTTASATYAERHKRPCQLSLAAFPWHGASRNFPAAHRHAHL